MINIEDQPLLFCFRFGKKRKEKEMERQNEIDMKNEEKEKREKLGFLKRRKNYKTFLCVALCLGEKDQIKINDHLTNLRFYIEYQQQKKKKRRRTRDKTTEK